MANQPWPTGIRPNGNGIEIRIAQNKRAVYDRTFAGNPYNKRDLSAAVKFRDELKSRLSLGLPLEKGADSSTLTFEQAASIYLNSLDCKESSLNSISGIMNSKWLPLFRGWPIADITDLHIQNYLDSLSITVKYKKNILCPLRALFKRSRIVPNPVDGVLLSNRLQKREKKNILRYTPKERDLLISTLEGEAKVYFSLLFGCGLRPSGEPLGLKWSDYDGKNLHIHKQVQHGKIRGYTKTDVDRVVTVPKWVRPILNSHDTKPLNGFIFVNPESETEGSFHYDAKKFNDAWVNAHLEAEILLRKPYTCRHTRAAELLSNGVNPAEAALELGHSVSMFLNTYSEFIAEFVDKYDKSAFE